MAILKNPGPLLTTKVKGSVRNIPDEYLANIGIDILTQQNPVDVEPNDLTGLLIESRVEQERTDERKKVNTFLSEPIDNVMVSKVKLPDGQIGTRTRQLVNEGTLLTANWLTVDADQKNLGNGFLDQTVVTTPLVFSQQSFLAEKTDPLPLRFRTAISSITTADTEVGVAAQPVLGLGEYRASQEQVDVFKKRVSLTTRASVSLPVTLIGYKLTADKQIETLTEIFNSGIQTLTANELTIEGEVLNLGDGTSISSKGVVSSLYTRPAYSIQIPDNVPDRFKVAIPTQTTEIDLVGSASMPTLGAGDLRASEQQVNVFVKRSSITSRGAVTLPVTLVSYRQTPQGQVETVTETYDSGLQTLTPTSLTVSGEVLNTGDGRSVRSVGAVTTVFGEAAFETRITDPVPERFRVAIPVQTTSSVVAGTASMPSLSAGDLIASEQQVTVQRKRTSLTSRASASLPVVLVSYRRTPEGQIETLTETYDTGLQTITDSSLTLDAEVQNMGDGRSLKSVGTVPTVFVHGRYTTEISDPLPPRFSVVVPVSITEETSAGTVDTTPNLSTGDLSRTEEQVTVSRMRVTLRSRAAVSLPVTLVGYKQTPQGQIETLTETYDSGLQTLSPTSLTVEGEVLNTGDGRSLKSIGAVASVFGEATFETRISDPVPERFRVAIPTQTTSSVIAGTAAMPTLSAGDLSASEQQITVQRKRTSLTSRAAASLPVTLISYKLTGRKQVETLTETYDSGLQTLSPTGLWVEGEVLNTGDGRSLKSVGTVASLFTHLAYERQRGSVTPTDFAALLQEAEVSQDALGTATDPTLGTGDISASDEQLDPFTHRTRVRSISTASLPSTIVNKKTNQFKQVETVTRTLEVDSSTPATPSALQTVIFTKLGDGTALQEVTSIASLFGQKSSSTEIADLVPIEFRGVVKTYVTEETLSGTIIDPPILSVGDLEKTEVQVDLFTKRVRIKGRAGISLPVTLVGGQKIVEKFGVQLLADKVITLGLAGSLTIPTGPLVVEAEKNEIGGGMEVATSLVSSAPAWPVLISKLYDEEMRVIYTEERQIVDPATVPATPAPTATFLEELKAVDQWHSWRIRTTKIPTAISEATAIQSYVMQPYTFPGRVNIFNLDFYGTAIGYKKPHADLVKQLVKTWWVISPTKPNILIDEIITDTIEINGVTYDNVLHDSTTRFYNNFPIFLPATSPSYSQFVGNLTSVVEKVFMVNGSANVNGQNTHFLSLTKGINYTWPGGDVAVIQSIQSDTNLTLTAPYTGPTTTSVSNQQVYTGGWVGTYRVVGASVEPDKQPNLWRVATRSVLMR